MKIVIVGAGFTGIQLAKRLVNGKNDVTLIDNDKDAVSYAESRLDCEAVFADGNNLSTLEEVGIENADALVCVTSNDEVNMITCSLVDSVYPNVLKIARVRNYAYYVNTAEAKKKHESDSKKHRSLYGIDFMISPDFEAAQAIVNSIERNSVMDSLQFDNSPYEILRINVESESKFDGQALKDLWKLTDKRFLVAYIERNGVTSLPYGETIVNSGDILGILIERKYLEEVMNLCGSKIKNIQKIAIVGAGRIGTIVAERLDEKNITKSKILMIDNNEEKLNSASKRLSKNIRVFKADVTDEGFIEEENINECDLLICSTLNYEMNIVTAAYIESLGVENSIVLVPSDAYGEIARKLGIDVAVSVRDTVVDSIMSHLRGSSVTGIHTVNGGFLEIAEVIVSEKSKVVGKKLMEISDKGKFLILMGHKKDELSYSIKGGQDILNAGDKIVLIMTRADSQNVLKRFT